MNFTPSNDDDEQIFAERLIMISERLKSRKALLIVHDYNCNEDQNARWNKLPCDILITTWADWHNDGIQIDLSLNDLSVAEGIEILRKNFLLEVERDSDVRTEFETCFTAEMESVTGIVEMVERHPLCLALLGRQMGWDEDDFISPDDMFAELSKHKELFEKFGGHPMAAGL